MKPRTPAIPTRRKRWLQAGLVIGLAGALLACALSVPFVFESPSIHYKFGVDKTLLRTGKLLGMAAAALIFLQLLLAARLKVLDRIFSLPRVVALHRINGSVIAVLALLHPVFILGAENFALPPLRLEYWPEAAGLLLLILICLQAGVSGWRRKFSIAFERWRLYHRSAGVLILFLLTLHVLFVSGAFAGGVPRYALPGVVIAVILVFVLSRFRVRRSQKNGFHIAEVIRENRQVTTLVLSPENKEGMPYLPGQFAFISPMSDRVSKEPHPFTLSSTPTRPESLMLSIKACGDWTSGIGSLQKGDRVYLEGPFGRFTHLACPVHQPLVLIAGGIGITPMLSMLRYMRDTADGRPVLLLWFNKTKQDLVRAEELACLEEELTGLTLVHTFTREKSGDTVSWRLHRQNLEVQLRDADRSAAVFICGPPRMMAQVARDIRIMGFPRRAIHTEPFSL